MYTLIGKDRYAENDNDEESALIKEPEEIIEIYADIMLISQPLYIYPTTILPRSRMKENAIQPLLYTAPSHPNVQPLNCGTSLLCCSSSTNVNSSNSSSGICSCFNCFCSSGSDIQQIGLRRKRDEIDFITGEQDDIEMGNNNSNNNSNTNNGTNNRNRNNGIHRLLNSNNNNNINNNNNNNTDNNNVKNDIEHGLLANSLSPPHNPYNNLPLLTSHRIQAIDGLYPNELPVVANMLMTGELVDSAAIGVDTIVVLCFVVWTMY